MIIGVSGPGVLVAAGVCKAVRHSAHSCWQILQSSVGGSRTAGLGGAVERQCATYAGGAYGLSPWLFGDCKLGRMLEAA